MAYIWRSTYNINQIQLETPNFLSFGSHCLEHDLKCKHVTYHLGAPPLDVNATINAALTLIAARTFEKETNHHSPVV